MFWDYVYRPVFQKLENITFLKLVQVLSSGDRENTYSIGSLRKS
jgi:hypothetical protein